MKIEVKQGLNLPLKGKPAPQIEELSEQRQIALNLAPFDSVLFKLLVKLGDPVKLGQPLLENKAVPGQFFVSPAAGTISEIRRGLKRRLLDIVINKNENEASHTLSPLNPKESSKETIISRFLEGGLFPHIRRRPFAMMAKPSLLPRDIFVNCVETSPFTPSAQLQVEGNESYFQAGLHALSKIVGKKVHVITPEGSNFAPFLHAEDAEIHQISGPHPAGNISIAIHQIAPIRSSQETVWTLSALDAVTIGRMCLEGKYHVSRVVAVGGEGIIPGRRKYYKTRMGIPIQSLVNGSLPGENVRLISGDPLMGEKVAMDDFLGFHDTVVSVLFENNSRESFHFLRLGGDKFTATRAYLSGHRKLGDREYTFTTNQHGENRAFIDGNVYNKVMPLPVPTMMLVKAILAEDFPLAEELGILEVAPEDFALPTFICPSKIEMVDIVKQGLKRHAIEVGQA